MDKTTAKKNYPPNEEQIDVLAKEKYEVEYVPDDGIKIEWNNLNKENKTFWLFTARKSIDYLYTKLMEK